MSTRRFLFLMIGLLPAAVSAQEAAAQKELARLRGTWKFVALEIEGVKAQPEQFKNARMTLQGEEFTMTDGSAVYKGTFKVDVGKDPKHLDVSFADGPEKGKTSLGIYEVNGETWKLCLGLAGKDRPREFVSKPGSGHVLEVLQREKR